MRSSNADGGSAIASRRTATKGPSAMTSHPAPGRAVVLVTGMSGAGRSTAARCLEDLGWFVVDNLPPGAARPRWSSLGRRDPGRGAAIAVVVDVRGRRVLRRPAARPRRAARRRASTRACVFLEAADDVLVRRFESVRRPHPLQGDGRILDGIAARARAARRPARPTPTS